MKAEVIFSGDFVCHRWDQIKRRPVRGEERDALSHTLSTKLPRTVFLESIERLDDTVVASGCPDNVPATGVMKTVSWSKKKQKRRHRNEMISLQKMVAEEEAEAEGRVIQNIGLYPKSVMLYSLETLNIFFDRCKEDIVYLDATGSIVRKGKGQMSPFYVYELVVRHPTKGSSPLPVATYITSDHTTASVSHFLGASKHYHLTMHVFGVMTRASTLKELNEVVISANVVFSSSHSGQNVEKHFKNLQMLLTKAGPCAEDTSIKEENYENNVGTTPFTQHFQEVIETEECDQEGDLGRHGSGPVYDSLTTKYSRAACKSQQNYTLDNKTQGIMEKSQWDLKQIRFQRKNMTRLDDFVDTYKVTLKALLREYADSQRRKKKTHRVDVERWKSRKQSKRGVYVCLF
ncbi:hypothetical protein D5F01_LYC09263 [Larimichthys crocea]|uniref:Uncharacterized protein n=1 Tax=Larimichthys crocea TaxID=215358 RepID=A0A6G0IKW5_LARCR|nr:hypothetical protein D5F01_LYC09263 [Larimichthys crocea]